jgi:hypothetical protein
MILLNIIQKEVSDAIFIKDDCGIFHKFSRAFLDQKALSYCDI